MRNEYSQKLNGIKDRLVDLLNDIESMIGYLFDSTQRMDVKKQLEDAENLDKLVRTKTKDLLDLCTEVVTLQQPMATDIRLILSAIRIKNDLERSVRDSLHIIELADTVVESGEKFNLSLRKTQSILLDMVEILKQSLVENKSEILLKLNDLDEIIDEFYAKMNSEIRSVLSSNPDKVLEIVDFLLVIRMIERIADHFCNIAEKIYYIQTAKVIRIA